MILIFLPTLIFASYNPFFTDKKATPAPEIKKEEKQILVKPRVRSYVKVAKKKDIKMNYYGFVQSEKGTFALVEFNDKNIVISVKDTLYDDEQTYKIRKITSNYIQLKDRLGRFQTVYFSSAKQNINNQRTSR